MTTAAIAVATPALAVDVWTAPYPGVRHLHRTWGRFDYHVVIVDLRNPRVQIVGTPESMALPRPGSTTPRHRWTRTTAFAAATGADIAINANYFDIHTRKHSVCGLTVSEGRVWRSTYDDARLECDDSIGFGPGGRAEVFDSRGALFGPVPAPWMSVVVTGSPRLLRDGQVVEYTHPRHALQRNPRTALGLSADRRTLYIMVVNGREGRALGMTGPEMARALLGLGAHDAINLDGGGSSALFIRREHGIVSHCADGSERDVGNHLGIVFRDPPPESEPPPKSQAPSAPAVAAAPPPSPPPRPTSRRARPRVSAGATVSPKQPRGRSILAVVASVFVLGAGGIFRRRRGARG